MAIIFSQGKGAFLIAGYNTLLPEEKAKYDEKALCRFMGKLMFALSGLVVLIAAGVIFDKMLMVGIGSILLFAAVIIAVIYVNTGNRFKNEIDK